MQDIKKNFGGKHLKASCTNFTKFKKKKISIALKNKWDL